MTTALFIRASEFIRQKQNRIHLLRVCLRGLAPSRLLLVILHSCFGILSSFQFRISSFAQLDGSLPDRSGPARDPIGPNGTQWDPKRTQRDPFGTRKGHHFSPVAGAFTTHNHFASKPLCLMSSKPQTRKHVFSPSATPPALRLARRSGFRRPNLHPRPWSGLSRACRRMLWMAVNVEFTHAPSTRLYKPSFLD